MFQKNQPGVAVKIILTVILIALLTVLQTTVLRGIEVLGVIPNLLFITVVCYSLLHADYSALVMGVACGLLLDITGGRIVGMNALLCTLVAYFCICISGSLFNNNIPVAMLFVLLLTVPYELITYIFYFVIWGQGSFWYALLLKILPAAVYNALAAAVLYPLVRKIAGSAE